MWMLCLLLYSFSEGNSKLGQFLPTGLTTLLIPITINSYALSNFIQKKYK
ncbi:hypothetical protein LCUFL03_380104 [Latilactobacillus curvatus]|nr:hypothetical protein LCUFL03_380104 [Latilactobacillus curvatus]